MRTAWPIGGARPLAPGPAAHAAAAAMPLVTTAALAPWAILAIKFAWWLLRLSSIACLSAQLRRLNSHHHPEWFSDTMRPRAPLPPNTLVR